MANLQNAKDIAQGIVTEAEIAAKVASLAPDEVIKSTTAPTGVVEGQLWYDTTSSIKALKFYNGSEWLKVSPKIPTITDISTKSLRQGQATSITITGINFLSGQATVKFTPTGSSTVDVVVTPTSDTELTVAVPSSVYNLTSGTDVAISIENSDKATSSNVSKKLLALPTGGTVTTADGYRIHTFTSSGSLTIPGGYSGMDIQYLVVGGGGAGGSSFGGGGGAGGLRTNVPNNTSGRGTSVESAMSISTGTYAVTVGAGGTVPYNNAEGNQGGSSVFNGITALGGGGGGCQGVYTPTSKIHGGCGAGVSHNSSGYRGAGTAGQGYDGGPHWNQGPPYPTASGGGAGEAGLTPPNNSYSPRGGNGLQNNITGSQVYYAGGGGGGAGGTSYNANTSQAIGGLGGGGAAGPTANSNGRDGTANTGGGGGGSHSYNNGSYRGGYGGSGIVIVRYLEV